MKLPFRPHHRIQSTKHFARAFRTGSRARGSVLLVVVCENGLEHSRLGLSIGKKVWKSAVKRNRVRRVFREAFRHSLPELPGGLDVVLVAAAPRLEPGLEGTRAELLQLVPKALSRLERKRAEEAQKAAE